MAVIAALELEYLRASGGGARDPQCRHHRFGARIHKTQILYPWNSAGDVLSQFETVGLGRAQTPASPQSLLDRRAHGLIAMPEDQRSEGHAIVEIFAPVNIS